MNNNVPDWQKAMVAAFPKTIPIFAGFWFLGLAYGILMNVSGFSFWYPMLMSMLIFGGSLEFVAVGLLLSPFAPFAALLLALMIQARHLFYGIAMLDRYRGLGWKKPILVFGMCDESFAINFSARIPEGVDRGWFMLWVTVFNWLYWVSGCTLGGIAGSLLRFDTNGLGFVMTAMFVVIFLEQYLSEKRHWTALVGFVASIGSLVIFGPERFMVPAMLGILALLMVFRSPISGSLGEDA